MGRVLRHNTVVRRTPHYGEFVFLAAGTEVPEWAEGLLGDHLFEDGAKADTPSKADRNITPPEPAPEPEPEVVEVPHRGAHVSKWRKFLEAHGEDVQKGTSRDEMIELAEEKFPDIEIPDDEE